MFTTRALPNSQLQQWLAGSSSTGPFCRGRSIKRSACATPRVAEALLREVELPTEVPFTSRGTRVPGAPVGPGEFCVSFARERVAEVSDDIAAIGRMTPLHAQHCLLQGAIRHRLNHLWREIPDE